MTEHAWTNVDEYLNERLVENDPALQAALADSAAAGMPAIAVAPNQGKLLNLLARLSDARRILEVGTLGGYSAIWLARALPTGGRLITLELNPLHAQVAEKNLARAGVRDKVEIRVGPALETLARLASEKQAPFDLSFIDADKQNNAAYFDRALAMSRRGSLIIVDNVVRQGGVTDGRTADPAIVGTRKLFDRLSQEPRVDATAIQTVGVKGWDGLAIALVIGDA
ncbi:MAG TPA: O-methyltransferase [Polyangia bacterium]|nr:O-methyltransferase [Polyangia bacterium]